MPPKKRKAEAAAAASSSSSASSSASSLAVGDKIKVFYKDGALYDAKIIKRREDGASCEFLVHYHGWNKRSDEWIKRGRIAENLSRGKDRAGMSLCNL